MKPLTAIALMGGLVVLFVGGLVFQRCSFEHQLAAAQAQSTKADAQLVTTTEQLTTERDTEARTQATTTVRAAVAHEQAEVEHATTTGGLADYLDTAVRDADSRAGD